jgi:hypothetical protein
VEVLEAAWRRKRHREKNDAEIVIKAEGGGICRRRAACIEMTAAKSAGGGWWRRRLENHARGGWRKLAGRRRGVKGRHLKANL